MVFWVQMFYHRKKRNMLWKRSGILLVKTNCLIEGCILAKDVFSKTSKPIMSKKTIITNELKDVLQAFLINEVSVERNLVNGDLFAPKEVVDIEDIKMNTHEVNFISVYLDSVQQFKRLFKGWQAGATVDITSVRKVFVPLLELGFINNKDVFSLHHYSTKSDYFYHHLVSVGLISGYLAKQLNFGKGDIVQVALAGCLCDVGMAKIPQNLLEKKTSLTLEEYNEIKRHPVYGQQLLRNSATLKNEAKMAILQHHERLDGSGYPNGEKGNRIHIFAKIVAIADVYHAMTSERVYRRKQSPFRVLEMIMHDDFGKFDIEILNSLVNSVVSISIGSVVKLSDESTGTVIFMNSRYPTRPVIKLTNGTLVDLERNRELFILETH